MDIPLLTEDIIKKAADRGCEKSEVFVKMSKGLSAEAKGGGIEAMEASEDFGIALRAIKKQRLGFSYATTYEDIEKMVNEAVNGADWTAPDGYIDIPKYIPPAAVSVFDNEIEDLTEEDVIRKAVVLEESALSYDPRIKKVRKALIAMGKSTTTIVNSRGINVSYKTTYISAQVMALAQDMSGDSQIGWEFGVSRRMKYLDLNSIGRGAAEKAIALLGSKKITPLKAVVILEPSVAVEFLNVLSASLSAEAVQKKRSFLEGKKGKTIISPLINLVDDGILPWGIGTRPVDDEGTPTYRKVLISNGVLTGYIHNTYTAKKDGTVSTGNAVRGSFKSLPGVGTANLYIEPDGSQKREVRSLPARRQGQKSESKNREGNKLTKSVSRGILITNAMGIHTANPVSGDFSIGISGLWVEDGEPLYPIKEAVISGNILELFKKVEMVGKDLRFYGSTGSPSLLIGEMDVSA